MTEQSIKRFEIGRSSHVVPSKGGRFVIHSDHLAARAADKAEIERLKGFVDVLPADWRIDSSLETWFPYTAEALQLWRTRAEKAEARIAELETGPDEAVRRDAGKLKQAIVNGYGGSVLTNESFTLHYELREQAIAAHGALTNLIDAAIDAAKSAER